VERSKQEKAWADGNLEFICGLPQRDPDEQNPTYPPGQDPEYDRDYPPCFATFEDVQGTRQKVWHHGQMQLWNDLQGSKYEPVRYGPEILVVQTDLQPLLYPNQRPWSLNREEDRKGQAFTATHYSEGGKISHDYAPPPSMSHQSPPYGQQYSAQSQCTQASGTLISPITDGMSAFSQGNSHQSLSQVQSNTQQPVYGAPGHTSNGFSTAYYGSTTEAANAGFGQHESPF